MFRLTEASERTWIVLVFTHEWDETRALFRNVHKCFKHDYKINNMCSPVQTMVQRGSVHWRLTDFDKAKAKVHSD